MLLVAKVYIQNHLMPFPLKGIEKMRVVLFLTFLTVAYSSVASNLKEQRPPNIILVVADDLNCSIGPYGDQVAQTPNLSKLADRGLTFERAYCQQAVCNPSRSSFLTGLRPDTIKVDDLRKSFRETTDRGDSIITLPQYFKNRGYFCQNIGKMFHNMGETQDRQSWSVDEVLHKGTHAADTIHNNTPVGNRDTQFVKAPVVEALDVPDFYYRDGQIANLAASVLRDYPKEAKPFFLAVGFWRPHLPFVAPSKYWEQYKPSDMVLPLGLEEYRNVPSIALHDSKELWSYGQRESSRSLSAEKIRQLKRGYYASISFLDAQLGKILEAVNQGGHAENTIIVFVSDHGFHLGERDLWGKTTNFELDARVPLIIADPKAMASHGKTTVGLFELVDLYPTLVTLAGLGFTSEQFLDGVDQSELFEDPSSDLKQAAFTQHAQPFYRPRKEWEANGYSVRTRDWRYTEWRSIGTEQVIARELYNHVGDSDETINAVHLYPEVAAKHSILVRQQFPGSISK